MTTQDATYPRVAVAFRSTSPSAMLIHQAAAGRYRIIWLIDTATAELGPLARLLRRLGAVVDIAGLDVPGAAAALAAEHPDGITTFSDELLTTTAAIAAELDLPYFEPDVVVRLVDKAEQRAALAAGEVAVPGYVVIPAGTRLDELAAITATIAYPAVLKPRQGQASRYTFAVHDLAELERALGSVGGQCAPFPFVIEEYIPDGADSDPDFAGYLSVESVVVDGHAHNLATTGRFRMVPPFRESGFFIPAALPDDTLGSVLDLATRSLSALGVRRGAFHTEIKLTPDGPRLIEVNGRPGGGIPEMLAAISSVNLFSAALDIAVGANPLPVEPITLHGVGYLLYMHAPVGRAEVAAVRGLDALSAHPDVDTVFLNRPPGSILDWRDGNHGYAYSATGTVPDHAALRDLARFVRDTVAIDLVENSVEPAPRPMR